MDAQRFETVIIGGGPAGATAAATLAREGHRVAVCERERFPRFHIGESLLPAGNELFRAIGVWNRIKAAGFIRKAGAEFESADGTRQVHVEFAQGLLRGEGYTYQVERSRFDRLLLDHARESGASVFQPVGVSGVEEIGDGWAVHLSDGTTLRASFLIDASGREKVLARQQKIPRRTLPYPRKIAVYSQFNGLPRNSGSRAGNIIITRWQDGWFWQIPIDAERTSVGLVSTLERFKAFDGSDEAFFRSVVAATPVLAQRFESAEPTAVFQATADYTYMYEAFAGKRFLLAGDAACFIDPVFSSGVYLAMHSGNTAARLVGAAIHAQRPLSHRIQKKYTAGFVRRVDVMRGLIDTFYDRRGLEVFFSPSNRGRLFDAVNSVVAGHTHLPWPIRWRYHLFLAIVKLHQRWGRMVPPLEGNSLGQRPLENSAPS